MAKIRITTLMDLEKDLRNIFDEAAEKMIVIDDEGRHAYTVSIYDPSKEHLHETSRVAGEECRLNKNI